MTDRPADPLAAILGACEELVQRFNIARPDYEHMPSVSELKPYLRIIRDELPALRAVIAQRQQETTTLQDALIAAFYDPDPVEPDFGEPLNRSRVEWVGVIQQARRRIDHLKDVIGNAEQRADTADANKELYREMCEKAQQAATELGQRADTLAAELEKARKMYQDSLSVNAGECPICIELKILPSRPYACFAHSLAYDSEVVQSRDAEIERLEAEIARLRAMLKRIASESQDLARGIALFAQDALDQK